MKTPIEKISGVLAEHFPITCRSHGEKIANEILSLFTPFLPPNPWSGQEEHIFKFLEELHRLYWGQLNYIPTNKMPIEKLSEVIIDLLYTINGYKQNTNMFVDALHKEAKEVERLQKIVELNELPENHSQTKQELLKALKDNSFLQKELINLQQTNYNLQQFIAKSHQAPNDTVTVICPLCQKGTLSAQPNSECTACKGEGTFLAKIAKER